MIEGEPALVLYGLDDPKRQSSKYYRDVIQNSIMHKKKSETKHRQMQRLNINRQSEEVP
jgi:hypothetical protein